MVQSGAMIDTTDMTDPTATTVKAATIDSLQAVPAGQGDHHFFLNHLATVKVGAGQSESGLALVEFVAPRGFGPPLHVHNEEDELMYVLEGEIRLDLGNGETDIASAGTTVTLPHGTPHTWQVVSDEARFLTINAGRRNGASFDQMVAALGTPADPQELPDPVEIDPGHVAEVLAAHGIDVLGPPPAPLD
jgi:quercetin dioxygenase-like cupin family protein